RIAMGMFTQVGPLLIYFAGGYCIIKNIDPDLTVGVITATVALINRLYRPIESLMNISVDFTRSLALFTRIFDYFDRENTIVSPEDGKKPDVDNKPITYDHVAFSYNPESKILKDVNFEVPGGSMYAIVGPSGSGKSTVVNLIPRLYDVDSGSVRIAGVDVRDFDLEYLRQCVGVVTQETYLFNGTILENLRYANDAATMEEIEEACRIANIHDFISSQPEGYNTQVGNRGLKLSGGEKQRISLARVILKDPKILILDEATSALDSISENSIQDALERMMEGRTSIVIAHRLSTILKADRILVVKDGVIAEQGTHEELLALGGTYKELYETQFRKAIESESARNEEEDSDGVDVAALSTEYTVRRITEADISPVYRLAKTNAKYYEYMHTVPTRESLTEIISELPEGSSMNHKHFVGFYDRDDVLVAVMDLITGYPEADDAFIGWLMVDGPMQGKGVGSGIFADVRSALKAAGYDYVSLGCIEENAEAMKFWEAQGFRPTGRKQENEDYTVLVMARDI
ncbi:MAG: GNAT family N-acetyltransferase, partial [Firmicutes bacterium]|nr:GNAT family N-acetyltransferase [Bacillota bacterium]